MAVFLSKVCFLEEVIKWSHENNYQKNSDEDCRTKD
jgi:hypothetical protein